MYNKMVLEPRKEIVWVLSSETPVEKFAALIGGGLLCVLQSHSFGVS